jgi:5-methylcytosine-specific restriction endonuclease McrA
MVYKDKEKKKKYQRDWVAYRRDCYFADKSCTQCGSTEKLELDHIEQKGKVTSSIWSWSKVMREKELAKCQVLCHDCHKKKTRTQISKLTLKQYEEIKASDLSERQLAKKYEVSRITIRRVKGTQPPNTK